MLTFCSRLRFTAHPPAISHVSKMSLAADFASVVSRSQFHRKNKVAYTWRSAGPNFPMFGSPSFQIEPPARSKPILARRLAKIGAFLLGKRPVGGSRDTSLGFASIAGGGFSNSEPASQYNLYPFMLVTADLRCAV